jgi:lysophospholipase L1-like esterase
MAGTHELEVIRTTETWLGVMTVEGFTLSPQTRMEPPSHAPERRLLFIGDSVTCGERADRGERCSGEKAATWNAAASFGMRLGRKLGAQVHLVSYGGRGVVRDWQGKRDVLNAPQFLDRSVPEGPFDHTPPELRWDHQSYVPDGIVLSLGTNDFNLALGEFPSEREFVDAYVLLVSKLRALYPRAQVFLTEGAIVIDTPDRAQKTILRRYLKHVAEHLQDPRVHVIEAQHYPGDHCDAHPTSAQHEQIAQDLLPQLKETLGW